MYVFKIDIFACLSLPINTRQFSLKNPALDVFIFCIFMFCLWSITTGQIEAAEIIPWSPISEQHELLILSFGRMVRVQRWQPVFQKYLVWDFYVNFTSLFLPCFGLGRPHPSQAPKKELEEGVGPRQIYTQIFIHKAFLKKVLLVYMVVLLDLDTNLVFLSSCFNFYIGGFLELCIVFRFSCSIGNSSVPSATSHIEWRAYHVFYREGDR